MILFALRCSEQHEFEGWFRDGAAYEAQAAAGDITCPVCGTRSVTKAPMAPRVARRYVEPAPPQVTVDELRRALLGLKQQVQAECDSVGDRFPEEARRIHYGECDARPIYGEATQAEVRDLREEGVVVMALPWINDAN